MEAAVALFSAVLFGVPGIRLIRLWNRNGGLPELFLAVFFIGIGIGTPLRLYMAVHRLQIQPNISLAISATALTCLVAGASGLIGFCWLTFRADSRWARILTSALWAGLAILYLVLLLLGEVGSQTHPLALAANGWAIVGFLWCFLECCTWYRLMRRRARLGLGDPVVCNRFLLWSLWTGAFSLLTVAVLAIKLFLLAETAPHEVPVASPAIMRLVEILIVAAGATAFVAIWLSFFPPAAYSERLRRRAA